jgi:hypothetical protein
MFSILDMTRDGKYLRFPKAQKSETFRQCGMACTCKSSTYCNFTHGQLLFHTVSQHAAAAQALRHSSMFLRLTLPHIARAAPDSRQNFLNDKNSVKALEIIMQRRKRTIVNDKMCRHRRLELQTANTWLIVLLCKRMGPRAKLKTIA